MRAVRLSAWLAVVLLSVAGVLGTIGSAQERHVPDKEPQAYTMPDSYDVLSSILEVGAASVDQFVIGAETVQQEMCVKPSDEPDPSIRQAIVNYIEVNRNHLTLQERFKLSKPYKMITAEELRQLTRSGWDLFHRTYPNIGGVRYFSAVGFNESKTIAIVHYSIVANRAAFGETEILQKTEATWKRLPRGMCQWLS